MDNGVPVSEYKNSRVGIYGGKFFPFHLGHMSFIKEAIKEVDVLFVVVQYDEEYERSLIQGTNFPLIPGRIRERWITEIYKDNPKVRVFSQYEHRSDYPNYLNDPLVGETYKELLETIGGHLDVVFSNTHEYDEYFNKWLPGVEHRVLLENREISNISASQIRSDGVYKQWDMLPKVIQKFFLKRIAFCGWESVGKTYTAQRIAKEFNTTYLPEYGRTYTEELGGYDGIDLDEDYPNIMAGHLQALHYANGNKFLSIDTDLIYTQFFYWKQNQKLHPVLDVAIKANVDKIDHYIFLDPYNDFHEDGSRFRLEQSEREITSEQLKAFYKDLYKKDLHIVSIQDNDERYQIVKAHVEQLVL